MRTENRDSAAIEIALLRYEIFERLKRAIDYRQQRLMESAKEEREHRLAQDPSDACVSVHIRSIATKAPESSVPRAGYLPKRGSPGGGERRPRLA
jgi:hypothetical protein